MNPSTDAPAKMRHQQTQCRRSKSWIYYLVLMVLACCLLPVASAAAVQNSAWSGEGLGSAAGLSSGAYAKLTGAEQIGQASFGSSVALSADGNTALVGGEGDNGNIGAAWVFTRSGSTWVEQAKLRGVGEGHAPSLGLSVALSSDGNTAVIGGFSTAWVFTRSGSSWTQQAKLPGGGVSVALSADGSTAMIGKDLAGAAGVFVRSGSTWTQQASLTPSENSGGAQFGRVVRLSADGNTALVGAPDDHHLGAAWIFTRSGSTWTQQGAKLLGSGMSGRFVNFGFTAALSADGSTALIGGLGDHVSRGAAWVFTRSGSTWTQQGPKLSGNEEIGQAFFGFSVALAANGNTALVGGWGDRGGIGAAWVFSRSGSTWTQQGAKLTRDEKHGAFGHSVALSANGETALVGSTEEFGPVGTAWVFTSPFTAPGKSTNAQLIARAIRKCQKTKKATKRIRCVARAKDRYHSR